MGAKSNEEKPEEETRYHETARQAGIYDALGVVSGALSHDEIPEEDVRKLWDDVTDSLMRTGWFERDGAKLIKAGVVPMNPETIPGMPKTMEA